MNDDAGERAGAPKEGDLTSITVCGCKSISEERTVDVGALTILAGPNSAGKSSIMQPLLLLKQTLEAPFDPGSLLLDGPNVPLTSADQILSRAGVGARADRLIVGLGAQAASQRWIFGRRPEGGMDLLETRHSYRGGAVSLRPGGRPPASITKSLRDALAHGALSSLGRPRFTVERRRCFLRVVVSFTGGDGQGGVVMEPPGAGFAELIRGLVHLPGIRCTAARSYPKTAIGPNFPGPFETYVASLIQSWQDTKDEHLSQVERWARALGLTWAVRARRIQDTQVEILVGRLPRRGRTGAKDLVSIADVGVGVSQALPVLVALASAEPSQVVYLEQPEIHLHPRAQTALAGMLVERANRGVRVIVETHSAMLLLAIQYLVGEGRIASDKVKLHWFTRRPSDGVTEIATAQLDKAGTYGSWPEDFSDVLLEAQRRYLDATG